MKKNSMRLLGFILVAMMMVSLFAVNVFAEDTEKVAKIGDTEYATLQAAMTACVTGDNTITLLKDSSEVFTFEQKSGVNITIDGDGHTFSGKITLNAGGGNLTFTDAKIAPANSHTIYLNASDAPNVSFDHCVLEGKNMSGTIVYGYASSTENSVTVTNCTASNLQYIVSFRQRGSKSVLVENVTATNMIYLVRTLKCPSVTIKDVTCSAVIGIDIKNDAAGGKLVLENVNIDIFKYGGSLYIPVSGGGDGKSWTVEIKGTCMFTKEGRAYEGNEWFSGNAGYKIDVTENAIVNPPLWIGDEYYTSLDEVISKAQDGDTIVLKNSITDSDANAVLIDKNITLDLNGYDIDAEGILFNVSGHLTLEDSFEDQSGFIRVMYGKSENATAINLAQGGCFTLNGGNIYAEHKGVNAGNKSTARGDIVINGGSITTPHENVDPNSVECPAPIFINKNNKPLDLVINGGTLTGYYVILCDAPDSNIEITGGTLIAKGEDGFAVSVTASNVNIAITGGTFSHNIADEYCADGYICVKNGDMYTVEESPVAMIGDVTYATLQDAIDACVVGDNTITLLKDLSETVTIKQTEGINITIEGNGKYFSGTINVDGNNRPNGTETLTVQNVNFKKTDATTYAYFINAEKNAAGKNSEAHNLTVDNCTFESTNWHYAIATRHPYNLKVTNCTANKVYYFIYNPQGGESITVEDCTVTNATYGIGAQKCKNVYIKNYTYTGMAAGIYGRATSNECVMIMENVNVTTTLSGQPAIALWKNDDRTTSVTYTFIFKGENVLTTPAGVASFAVQSETNSPYVIKLADENSTLAATAGLGVTFDKEGYKVTYVDGVYAVNQYDYVAQVGDVKYESFADAIAAANAAENGATVTLLKDVTLGGKLTISGNVTIEGAYTITRADNYTGTLFTVNAGATLTLDGGLTIDGNNNYAFDADAFKADADNWNQSISKENSAKWFTPEAGKPVASAFMFTTTGGTINLLDVTVQNNYSVSSGVISAGANSTILMEGATVKHIASTQGNGVVANVSGANINVTVNEGTVIDGNHVGSNHGLFKIYSGAKLTMNGGEITNNTGWNSNGVAVGVYWGTFVMNGGSICSNVGVYGPNNGRNSAIYLHSGHNFEMNGGTICHNSGRARGGIDAPYDNGKAVINGGSVLDNVSRGNSDTYDVLGTSGMSINGGTFTQDVSKWLAPNTGLIHDEEKGVYTVTTAIWEMHLTDANGEAHWLSPMTGDTLASILSTSKIWYDSLQGGYSFTLKLLTDVKVDETGIVKFPLTIDLNGHTVTGVDVYPVIRVQEDATVTITGEGAIVNDDYVFVLGASDGTSAGYLTIENGKFYGETTVASVTKGTLTVNGGYFEATDENYDYAYTLNCVDANYKDGSAQIVVKGGTFYKFNPENNAAEGKGTDFVADSYKAVDNGDDTYTVKPVITVTFDDVTVVNGNAVPEFTYTTNFTELAGDGELLVVGTPVVEINGAGEYEITADAYVFMSDKYVVEVVPGTLTVVKPLVKANDGKNDLYFASIYDVLNYIQPRETWTITVLEDFTITADQRMYTNYSIIINAEYITLDLNGKTITFDYTGSNKECLASIAIYNKGTLTIVDSSEEKTGTLYSKTLIQNSDGPRIIWVTSAGTATIEGGNFISEQANTMFYTSNSNKDIPTQMIINGGYFEHTVPTESGRYRYFNKQNGYQTQIIEVNGGVFAHDFRDSEMTFGEGLTAQQLPDGKWGVVGAVAEVVDAEGNRVGKWSYATVQDAINACTNGETVRLLTDITYGADDVVFAHGGATGFGNYDQYNPSIIYVGGTKGATAAENQPSKVNVVIDLNGHTITSNADAYLFLFMDNCQVTMKDSVGGGKVVNNSESYPAIWAVGAETLVTIQSGTYQTASPYGLIHATHSGDLVIEGGYFSTTADDASLLLMINSQKYNNPNYFLVGVATLTVKGGTFEGFDPAQVGDDYGASSIADIKFVNGCAEGFVSKDNGDGTYTVLPVITVTFGDATVINGNALPEFTYTTNFTELAGDGELLVVGTPVVEINGAGEYEITADAYVFMSDKYVVEVIPGTLTVQAAVASVNGTNYATLSAAIDAAKAGDTVTLLANVIEDVTFNKNLTLDGSSFKYTGTIKISGNANVTIKNFDFDGGIIIHKGTNNTAKLTVQKCSFTNANSYAVTTERINNVTIEDCTVTNQSLLYAKLTTTDVVVRRVTVEGGNYVAHLVYGTTALFESVTATKMTGYGIFTQNYGAKTITVKNCSFDTPKYNSIAINETRSTNSDTFIFEGDNVMTSIENHEYLKLVLAEGATLTAPEGLTVTTNVADYKVAYENGTYFLVAKDYVVEINGVKYESIQEAINAAQDGDVITVIADHELTEIIKSADKFAYPVLVDVEKKVTIDLNGKTVTVNNPVADTKYSQFDLIAAIYVGGNGDLTLKDSVGGGNLTVTAGDSQIYTLLMADGENTKMLIESGHYELDKTANQSLIYAGGDKTITVTGGTFVLLNANPDISKIPWIFNCYGDGVNSVTVTGGTYNVDPTHYHGEVYYPKGYMAVENADGTWSVVKGKVYNETYGVTYMTIADAMAHAMTTTGKGDDVIVLLENHTESVVLVYDGTVLDVKDKTLTADYLVVFKGGFVTGNAYDKDGAHGQIKINKDRVVITEGALAQGQGYMMPVWNEDHYVFGLIGAITSGGSYGCTYNEETDEVELSFKVKATTDLNNDIMKLKGYSDHGLKVVVRVEWMVDLTGDGVADALQSRNYVYTDEMVQACAGKKMYVFSIGVGDRQNMRVVVDVVSDTGASLSSTEYVFNN